jgi:hypothetical protein
VRNEAVRVSAVVQSSGDPALDLLARYADVVCAVGPGRPLVEQLASLDELARRATVAGSLELAARTHYLRQATLLGLGDVAAARAANDVLARLASTLRMPLLGWYADEQGVLLELLRGNWDTAEGQAADHLDRGQALEPDAALSTWGAQTVVLMWGRGRLAELATAVAEMADSFHGLPVFRCTLAFLLAEDGDTAGAAAQLKLLGEPVPQLPADGNWLMAHWLLAFTCAALGDVERARVVAERLAPHTDELVLAGGSAAVAGAAGTARAALAELLEQPDLADALYVRALLVERRAGALPWVAHTLARYGRHLARTGRPEEADPVLHEACELAGRLQMPGVLAICAQAEALLSAG